MLARGFIGPIGDDLPSLIPLLVGLVIFFSTFTLTFSTFDERNTEFNDDVSVMRISRVMQSNSYIFSYDNFEELCGQVGLVNIKYVAALSDDAVTGADVDDIFSVKIFQRDEGYFFCSNLEDPSLSDPALISDFLPATQAADRKVISRI